MVEQKFNLTAAILIFLLFTAFSVIFADAQKNDEIKILRESGGKGYRCFVEENVVTPEMLNKITAGEECAAQINLLKVNFEKETLLAYHEAGDCHMRVSAAVFRQAESKKIIVKIKNYYGGCRAAGSFQGWLVTEKIPANYTVDFVREMFDQSGKKESGELEKSIAPLTAEARQIDLKNCIRLPRENHLTVKTRAEFLEFVRKDADREDCLKDFEPVDFEKNSLLGISLQTGYCRFPRGLAYQTEIDAANKNYLVNISYLDPQNSVCRALSLYDLWLLVPKMPDGFEAKFNVRAVLPETNR